MSTVIIQEENVLVTIGEQDFTVTPNEQGITVTPTEKEVLVATLGVPGPPGPAGPAGSGARYVHEQAVASSDWVIEHGLGSDPSAVTVVDTAGTVVTTEIRYLDVNTVRILSTSPFSGKAYMVA